jgi:mannosyl-3-phosphoglycerate phosphatase
LKPVFFTDLDGTLLDHETYSFDAAKPALSALSARNIPLVLASSKTGPELLALRSRLGLDHWPAIIENGAGELPSGAAPSIDQRDYQRLRQILSTLPNAVRRRYKGFGDMTLSDVVALTGLSPQSAQWAQQRAFTEPGVFDGSADDKARFVETLTTHGVHARDGGRFLTLSFGRTKADGLRSMAQRLNATRTIALGDAPNDLEMLLAADIAVVVRNDHSPRMEKIPDAIYTEQPGPAGWNEAVLELLKTLY